MRGKPVTINNKLIIRLVNKNKVKNFASLDQFRCICFVIQLLQVCLYERNTKFRHALVPECNLRAVMLDWLPRIEGRTNLFVE